jgi:hypothetical protein
MKHVVINLYNTTVNIEHKLFGLVKCVMGRRIPSYISSNIYSYTVNHQDVFVTVYVYVRRIFKHFLFYASAV